MKSLIKYMLAAIFALSLHNNIFAAKVDTLEIQSQAMNKIVKAPVILPDNYQNSGKNYPVIYLLHGGQGSYKDWLSKLKDKSLLHKLADMYQVIIVTPDGSPMGYYFDSPLVKDSQYETFISKELTQKIDGTYRTIKDKKGRIICGLSMGGHGAMFLATRHPDVYCAAGSMSGALSLNTALWKVPADFAKSRDQNFVRLLGPAKDTASPYREFSAVGIVDQMKVNDVKLIFDCGFDDIMIETNRELHKLLLANGTPHEYIERPGKHEWPYWENAVTYQFLFFQKVFLANGSLQ